MPGDRLRFALIDLADFLRLHRTKNWHESLNDEPGEDRYEIAHEEFVRFARSALTEKFRAAHARIAKSAFARHTGRWDQLDATEDADLYDLRFVLPHLDDAGEVAIADELRRADGYLDRIHTAYHAISSGTHPELLLALAALTMRLAESRGGHPYSVCARRQRAQTMFLLGKWDAAVREFESLLNDPGITEEHWYQHELAMTEVNYGVLLNNHFERYPRALELFDRAAARFAGLGDEYRGYQAQALCNAGRAATLARAPEDEAARRFSAGIAILRQLVEVEGQADWAARLRVRVTPHVDGRILRRESRGICRGRGAALRRLPTSDPNVRLHLRVAAADVRRTTGPVGRPCRAGAWPFLPGVARIAPRLGRRNTSTRPAFSGTSPIPG